MSQNNRDYSVQDPQKLHPLFERSLERVDVASELVKLRQEIQWLREMLIPPKSALIVGEDVERILKELK